MKRKKDAWDPALPFEQDLEDPAHRPPLPEEEEAEHQEDSPEFAAIRRVELLGRLNHMAFRSVLADEKLPPAQAGALRTIVRFPGMSQRELADKLHIQRATATVMLQKMEKSGYIDRRPDLEDQRISRIYPTEMALATDAENQKNVVRYFSRCFSGISDSEFAEFTRTLSVLETNLRTILRETPEPHGKEE